MLYREFGGFCSQYPLKFAHPQASLIDISPRISKNGKVSIASLIQSIHSTTHSEGLARASLFCSPTLSFISTSDYPTQSKEISLQPRTRFNISYREARPRFQRKPLSVHPVVLRSSSFAKWMSQAKAVNGAVSSIASSMWDGAERFYCVVLYRNLNVAMGKGMNIEAVERFHPH